MGRDLDTGFPRSSRGAPCELCDGREFQVVGRKDRRGKSLSSVLCTTCGLISHETLPTDAELDEYYAREYRLDYHGEFTPSPTRVLRAWRTGQGILRRMRPFLHEGDSVLEIGAGIGCTVKCFEAAGYEAEGIEPHHGFHAFGRTHLRARLRRCSLAELPTTAQFDVVLLVHVIEHFNHPRRELERIARLLKPGGRLYVECPNAEAPHAAPGKMFHFAHVYNFTNPTLTMLGRACGLTLKAALFGPERTLVAQVFTPAASAEKAIDAESYRRSVAALRRYNTFTYHVRPSYLAGRLRRAGEHLLGRAFARRRLTSLLQHLEEADTPAVVNLRRAA